MRIVIESPLAGDFRRNFRFLLWCMRACSIRGWHPIASHLLNPWFMDDTIPAERQQGINNAWVWECEAPHVLFTDLGISNGMKLAAIRCKNESIHCGERTLAKFAPECWEAFQRGEWPPHIPGFEVA